jgi:4-amino-4-deoxy-L-arabinose transferase-like glycosyltransferase
MFTKSRNLWLAALAFLLFFTAFTRLNQLGSLPAGLSWDEAYLGYVGKMVVTTGRDEYGRLLPRVFESFGDYKAPLAIYLTGLFTAAFGLHPWAVRLPFALAGIGSVWLMTRLGTLVFKNRWLGLLTGWWLAIMPWHLLFSRVAFESGLALFFYLLALVSWLELRSPAKLDRRYLLAAVVGVAGALYTYHSAKVVMPLALLAIAGHEWRHHREWLKRQWPALWRTGIALGLALLPLLSTLVLGKGGERAAQTSIFSQGLGWNETLTALLGGILSHLSLQFLIFGQTDVLRHGTGMWGQLGVIQLLFLLVGVAYAINRIIDQPSLADWLSRKFRRASADVAIHPWLWLALLLIGILPAAIGFELPHANRALLAVAPIGLLLTLAAAELRQGLSEIKFSLVVGLGLLLATLEFVSFWRFYGGPYRIRSGADWLQGYAEAVQMTDRYRGEGKSVKFTNSYGQPEIFFGFYLNLPTAEYRAVRVEGVDFGPVTLEDFNHYDVIVAEPREAGPFIPAYHIQRQNGEAAFLIYEKL